MLAFITINYGFSFPRSREVSRILSRFQRLEFARKNNKNGAARCRSSHKNLRNPRDLREKNSRVPAVPIAPTKIIRFNPRQFVVEKNPVPAPPLGSHGEVKNGSISRCSVPPP